MLDVTLLVRIGARIKMAGYLWQREGSVSQPGERASGIPKNSWDNLTMVRITIIASSDRVKEIQMHYSYQIVKHGLHLYPL